MGVNCIKGMKEPRRNISEEVKQEQQQDDSIYSEVEI